MSFGKLPTDDMRNIVRQKIETLERWLRRLIDDAVKVHHGGALSNLPINQDCVRAASRRRQAEPTRYPREVDALLFEDLITITCHPQLYPHHFRDPLGLAFPDGHPEARTFLSRIVEARNPLSHSNDITGHQALRALCYSTDVIESLKDYYARNNMQQDYNAPSLVQIWDDRGNSAQLNDTNTQLLEFRNTQLRPGDILELEVQPDESFPDDSYHINWIVCNIAAGERGNGRRFSLPITHRHVSQSGLTIRAEITSTRDWHRYANHDGMVHVRYQVLPPV